jgi:hypothetical protein
MHGAVLELRGKRETRKLKTPKHRPLARNRDPQGQQEGYRETSLQREVTKAKRSRERGRDSAQTRTGIAPEPLAPLADTDARDATAAALEWQPVEWLDPWNCGHQDTMCASCVDAWNVDYEIELPEGIEV